MPAAPRRSRRRPNHSRPGRVGARREVERRVVVVGGRPRVGGDDGGGRLDELTERDAAVADGQLIARQSVATHRSLRTGRAPALSAHEERVLRRRFHCYLLQHIHPSTRVHVTKRSKATNTPRRDGNSRAVWDHTVLPVIRQR